MNAQYEESLQARTNHSQSLFFLQKYNRFIIHYILIFISYTCNIGPIKMKYLCMSVSLIIYIISVCFECALTTDDSILLLKLKSPVHILMQAVSSPFERPTQAVGSYSLQVTSVTIAVGLQYSDHKYLAPGRRKEN